MVTEDEGMIRTLGDEGIRRVPVVDEGVLEGILTINDVAVFLMKN